MKSELPKIAVILCGGRGSRMGSLTKKIPKPLLKIHGKPIIWYSIKMLELYNFNKIIFPLGYKGEKIKNYIKKEFPKIVNKFFFVNTGINSSVSKRMHLIKDLIPNESNFFILNSDTIFNFNIDKMFQEHIKNSNWLTLSSVDLAVKWGLIIFDKNNLVDFDRKRTISNLKIKGDNKKFAKVNSGLAIINQKALKYSSKNDFCFESSLYKKMIKLKKAKNFNLKGLWFPVDTEKDLQTVNIDKKIGMRLNKI
jgi:glucose-1-phosphate cytidylyltransferase|tara:strand:- start:51 stop:806 length:756 start_codon:yes stop_codon:yes gene_type:complete